jgi:hypothetical protein
MQHRCSDSIREASANHFDKNERFKRQLCNLSKGSNTSSRFSRFTSVMAVAAAAAVYTVLIVDAFSTSSPHHHRIRASTARTTIPSTPQSKLRYTYSLSEPFFLFGRRMPSFATSSQLFLSSRGGKSSDQAEWKSVLMALQLYKAAYGDLKVPMRFVVPSMAPWPGTF